MRFLKKNTVILFILLAAIQSVFNNMVHPVTPAFIHHLELNDYMFGVAYASMNLMMFISSFYWGDASNKMKMSHILLISLVGYALAQIVFMMATTQWHIILGRLLAGAFSGGFLVGQMNFIVNQSTLETRGKNLANYSISMIVASTGGYLIGGLIGDINLYYPFILQIISLIILGVVNYVFLSITQNEIISNGVKRINPFKSMKYSINHLDSLGKLVFVSIFFAWMANIVFDNSFNYYIRDMLNYPPSANGILKAIIGVFTLISNLTLTYYLLNKTKITKSMMSITLFASMVIMVIIFNSHEFVFLGLSLLVLGAFSIIQPLQQTSVSLLSEDAAAVNHLMGFYNAIKSLAAIIGSLLAGFIYGVYPSGPFVLALVLIIVAFISLVSYERNSV